MNIDPLRRQQPVTFRGVTRRARSAEAESQGMEEAVQDKITRQGLVDQLMNMDEVRPDVVELGRRLAQDPEYPPEEVVRKLAEVISELPEAWSDEEVEEHEISPNT